MARFLDAVEEYPIDQKRKGLFVIITQLTHKVKYTPNLQNDYDWGTRRKLHYEEDEKLIMQAFNLDEKHGNVFKDRDLTNDEEMNSFSKFMDRVCAYESPQFIMVFLMSHGFENGDFLLASSGKKIAGKVKSKDQCCTKQADKKHTLKGNCHGRNFVANVMERVCNSFDAAIPKVFFNQTCRGGVSDLVHAGNADDTLCLKPSETELFIPPTLHNSFLFWACIEGSSSKVASTGSFLLQQLGMALNDLKIADQNFRLLLEKVRTRSETLTIQKHDSSAAVSQALGYLRNKREYCTGGWIMNVCQRTTALVTNKMLVDIILPSSTKLGQLLSKSLKEISSCSSNNFQSALRQHQSTTKHKKPVQKVIDNCSAYSWTMLYYLWRNVRRYSPRYHLVGIHSEKNRLELEEFLDGIIEEVARTKPNSKQQPHISSSFSRKLSFNKILQTQNVIPMDV